MSRMHNPAHPGEVLREYLPADMTVSDAARRLGVSRQTLSALLNKRAGVSAEMALRCRRRWAQVQRCGCRCRRPTTCGKPERNRAPKYAVSLLDPLWQANGIRFRFGFLVEPAETTLRL